METNCGDFMSLSSKLTEIQYFLNVGFFFREFSCGLEFNTKPCLIYHYMCSGGVWCLLVALQKHISEDVYRKPQMYPPPPKKKNICIYIYIIYMYIFMELITNILIKVPRLDWHYLA